jgi:hypothetical protein
MNMRSKLELTLLSSVLFLSLVGTSSAEHPARSLMTLYASDLDNMTAVNPYTVSIFALNEVEHNRHLDEVRLYILWYFSRLNYPDNTGLTGTIYDYVIDNDNERSTNQYDSVDGYAGMFLHLLHRYVRRTGNLEILLNHWDRVEDIAYLIAYFQDTDGLTRALPGRSEKYLMDNCESYGGMSAYIALRKLAGKGRSAYYGQVRHSLRKAILIHLYNPDRRMFFWAMVNRTASRTNWNQFYPDAYAQLFPLYFHVLKDNPGLQYHIWHEFIQRYKQQVSTFPIEQRIIYELTKITMEDLSP